MQRNCTAFLELASYYRRFGACFATIVSPLPKPSDKERLAWTKEYQVAFFDLRQQLMSSPILAYHNPQLPFLLDTDVSDIGIGAALPQLKKVIAYAS